MKTVERLLERVQGTIRRHRMIAHGEPLGVAVSGGADSVCALHVLRDLELGPITVLHVDHQLRGAESAADCAFVTALTRDLGLPVLVRRIELPPGNLEQAARRARLDFFRQTIASGAVRRVATGHTRSDQAETVLFRLLRGAAGAGLAGIRPVTSDGLIRPLIEVERIEVEQHLRERHITWREDSTNASRRFARNRIRHELLPALARDWNPRVTEALARTAEWAEAEVEYWNAEMDRLEAALIVRDRDALLVDAAAVAALPEAAARRLIRRAIERTKGNLLGVDFDHTDEALRLAAGSQGHGTLRFAGVEIRRSLNWLRFVNFAGDSDSGNYLIEVHVPGIVPVPGQDRAISLELIEKSDGLAASDFVYNDGMGCSVDWGRLSGPLALRGWMPGDRYQPAQSAGIKKLKTLFQEARIPAWERHRWPVLTDGASIVWTPRFGVAAGLAAGPETDAILRVREVKTR